MGSPQSGRAGSARAVVVVTVAIEAAVAAAYGVYLGVESVVAEATERLAAVVLTLMVLGLAAALAALARAVSHGRRRARAPVLVWQLLQASVAVPALSTRWPLGVGLLALCVVATVGVMRPEVLGPVEPES